VHPVERSLHVREVARLRSPVADDIGIGGDAETQAVATAVPRWAIRIAFTQQGRWVSPTHFVNRHRSELSHVQLSQEDAEQDAA
jgi:hypothetical protein